MEQRRLLIAFAVSLLLLVAYQEFVIKPYQKRRPAPAAPVAEGEAPVAPTAPPATPPASELAAADTNALSVAVETDVFRARITAQGARLAELQLTGYRRSVSPDSPPLDLVQPGAVLPLTLQVDEGVSDAGVVYRPDRPALTVHGDDRQALVFAGEGPEGLRLEKRFTFTGKSYLFEVTAAVSGETNRKKPAVGFVLTPVRNDAPAAAAHATAIALAERRLVLKSLDDLRKHPTPLDTSTWAGFAEQYFLTVAISDAGPARAVMSAVDGTPIVRVDAPLTDGRAAFDVYVGPKDREVLAEADHDLDRALDFGWFWFIAIPLLQALRFLHRVTGNYGVAIIVLTTLVKVATIPLTQTTFRNMREMQKIQPQMTKLRERFKDDQVALQKEMMELYRRHRVNPFSGCLPMVLQIPIFVGLYNTLSHAIELRHAPFALWINDLSAPDRLIVPGIPVGTPVIGGGIPVLTLFMGASMFLQQWLTPQQGDPTQQRMMMFMPLVFTFMFINFPAGLVLYWLVNNVLTIGQQYVMMRTSK